MKTEVLNSPQYISESFQVAKVIAIMSVILAHTQMAFPYPVMNLIKQRLSAIGVMVFIFISAYYFHPEKHNSVASFFRKKISTVIVPWIFLGSVVYVWTKLNNFSIFPLSASEWMLFLVGYKTFLYFIPIILVCYLLFAFLKSNLVFLCICMGITVVSLLCTSFGWLDALIDKAHLTHYLNPLNWIGYFSLGLLAAKFKWIEACISFFHRKRFRIILAFVIYMVLVFIISAYWETDQAGYFSKSGIIMQLFGLMLTLIISFLPIFHRRWLTTISGYTYSIYLVHMIFIRLVAFLSDVVPAVMYIAPIITLMFSYVTLVLIHKVTESLHIHRLTNTLLGLRE